MASRRAARGARRHRVLDLPVPAPQRGQGSRHSRCRDLGRGGGHRICRRRRAQARRPEPFRDGGADHAPGVAVLVAAAAIAIVATAVTFAVTFAVVIAASGSVIIFAATGPAAGSGANFAATVVTATVAAEVITVAAEVIAAAAEIIAVAAEIIAAIIIAAIDGAADHGAADMATAHAQAVTLAPPVADADAYDAAAGQLAWPPSAGVA
jgi:hypothetical protein